jgi:DNA-binding transcriptional LysR family regulator
MQNRRILDTHFREAGAEVRPHVETNSVVTLCSHLRSGRWSSVLPQTFLRLFGEPEGSRALPLTDPEVSHNIGLVVPEREPLTPSARELARLAASPEVVSGLAVLTDSPAPAAPPR